MNIEKLLTLRKYVKYLMRCFMAIVMGLSLQTAMAEEVNYLLGPGDVLKIAVYNNPDLTLETRISDAGKISFPLVGEVEISGITSSLAEKKLAGLLENGGFVKQPQINILVVQFQSKLVSVLGSVYKPGRYPLDRATNLVDLLALVGGATQDGSDIVTVIGKLGKTEYDLQNIGRWDGYDSPAV